MLNEHLSEDDLKWLVDDCVLIDMHKTKLGEDRDYIVLSIAVNDRTPAHDLARFLENSVYDFVDVEVSPATDSKGRYLIYVELKRNPESAAAITGMLKDSGKLTGISEWKFRTMGHDDHFPFNEATFNQYVVTDPNLYEQQHPSEKQEPAEGAVQESIKNRLKFLMNY
jgi:hypothetical protein